MTEKQVFKIADEMEKHYKGSGLGLIAVKDGHIIRLGYLRDIIDVDLYQTNIDTMTDEDSPEYDYDRMFADPAVGVAAIDFAHDGEVFFGMFSCGEFVVL